MPVSQNDPVSSIDDLLDYYHNTNPHNELYMGIELERSGIYRDTHHLVPYFGESGYRAVFQKLVDEAGWKIIEGENGDIFELQRGETRITTEGDGRPELSGSPMENLHDLTREFRLHDNELREMGNIYNIGWISLGFDPLHENDDYDYLPKKRYEILHKFFSNDWIHTHLKRLNGLTTNFSVTDEQNAIQKAQTAFRTIPMIAAMYASSPFDQGKLSGYLDTRRAMHHMGDSGRTGVPSSILDSNFGYEQWIAYYLDIPIIFIKTKKGDETPRDLTFRKWMQEGSYEGIEPTPFHFDQHVKTVWSDLRLRPSYIEHRVADTVPFSLAMSLPALVKGLIFDSESWEQVAELTKGWTYDDVIDADRRAWKTGLQTEVHGRTLLTYAQELITISNEKLHRFGHTDASGNDESVYLEALKEQMYIKEKSPAEELVSLYEGEWNGDISRMVEWCEGE